MGRGKEERVKGKNNKKKGGKDGKKTCCFKRASFYIKNERM